MNAMGSKMNLKMVRVSQADSHVGTIAAEYELSLVVGGSLSDCLSMQGVVLKLLALSAMQDEEGDFEDEPETAAIAQDQVQAEAPVTSAQPATGDAPRKRGRKSAADKAAEAAAALLAQPVGGQALTAATVAASTPAPAAVAPQTTEAAPPPVGTTPPITVGAVADPALAAQMKAGFSGATSAQVGASTAAAMSTAASPVTAPVASPVTAPAATQAAAPPAGNFNTPVMPTSFGAQSLPNMPAATAPTFGASAAAVPPPEPQIDLTAHVTEPQAVAWISSQNFTTTTQIVDGLIPAKPSGGPIYTPSQLAGLISRNPALNFDSASPAKLKDRIERILSTRAP